MAKQMTAERAWELISSIGWGTKTTDYKAVSQLLYTGFSKATVEGLERFVNDRVGELYKRVDDYEKETGDNLSVGSDDGFSDLRYHIVGLGKAEFEKCMANPVEMQNRSMAHDYTESFGYCFQEPEPPRTFQQKSKARADLMKEMDLLFQDLAKVSKALEAAQQRWNRLNCLAANVIQDSQIKQ